MDPGADNSSMDDLRPARAGNLRAENAELRRRLEEAEETIDAIRNGAVDAVVVQEPTGHRIYTLESADRPYRLFVEEMQQGAATLHADGTIAWCNRQLGTILMCPPDKLVGTPLRDYISPQHTSVYENLLGQGRSRSGRGEALLTRSDAGLVPVFLTFNALPLDCGAAVGVLITDLTPQRHHEQLSAAHAALRESEERFRQMADFAPVMVWVTDKDGACLFLSKSWFDFTGQSVAEGLGEGRLHAMHPDDRRRVQDEFALATERRAPFRTEYRLRSASGEYRWALDTATLRRGKPGEFLGYIGSILDITERKVIEDQSRRNHETFFNLIERSPFGLYVVDASFRLLQVSAASRKVFSRVQPLLGRDFEEILRLVWAEPFASEAIAHFRHTLETGEPYEAPNTTEQRSDTAAVESYDWKIERILLPDGRHGVVCYFYDITERKLAEQALREAQAQLQQHARELEARVAERTADLVATNKQLEAFAYSIAHDLRAPLRSMQGFSEIVLAGEGAALTEKGRSLIQRAGRSAEFMDALLQDLLAFSRTAQQALELTAVDLGTVVHSTVSRLEKEIAETSARLDLAGPWPKVLAHEPTLGQILFNLLNNALKFVSPAVTPSVRVRVEDWAGPPPPAGETVLDAAPTPTRWVRLWVEDNGVGIAPEHHEQIFGLFTRLHGQSYSGTGVGLAIVHKGIERMGGRTGVESVLGEGSRFWIELRRAEQAHR